MTSEMENVLKGQVVAKTRDLKQIAVSTSNLTPGPNGIAPLEKQNAFVSTVENKPVISSDEIISIHPATQPSTPVISSDEIISIHPATQPSTTALDNQASQTPETLNQVNPDENLESIDYDKPKQNEVLPVEVESTKELDSINIDPVNSILNQLDTFEESQERSEKTDEVKPMSLPQMDSIVNAQEPVSQDDRLFVGNNLSTADNSAIPVLDSTENGNLQPATGLDTTEQPEKSSFTPFETPPVEWPDFSKPVEQPQSLTENVDNASVPMNEPENTTLETSVGQTETQKEAVNETTEEPEVPLIDPTISEFSLQPQSKAESPSEPAITAEPEKNIDVGNAANTFIPPMGEEEKNIPSLEETPDSSNTETKSIFENEELEAYIAPLFEDFKAKLIIAVNEYIESKADLEKKGFASEQVIKPNTLNQEIQSNDNNQIAITPALEQSNVISAENTESNDKVEETPVDKELIHGKFI